MSFSSGNITKPNSGSENVALYSLIVFKWSQTRPIILAASHQLSSFSFFHRSTMKEHILFHSRLIASRTPLGQRQSVEFEQNIGNCYAYSHPSGICVTLLSTPAYSMRVAFSLIGQTIKLFLEKCEGQWEAVEEDLKEGALFPDSAELLKTYQNPVEADKLLKVQKDLDEVKDVMLKNIDELLQRGEKLDDLMQRSEDLSNTSYQFYRQAKQNNRCCRYY